MLLQSGVELPNSISKLWTPLLLSIKNCHLETAQLLVDHGARVNIPEPAGTIASPLFNAVWKGRSDLVWLLLDNGGDVNVGSSRNSPLLMAARLGCVEITKVCKTV
jgi:ankyrin repeat protein